METNPNINPNSEAAALVLATLENPGGFIGRPVSELELIVRVLRRSGLLAWLAERLQGAERWAELPPRVRDHLEAARVVAAEDARMLRWEVDRIGHALRGTGLPVIALKGAAYLLAGLPVARGRLVADVDILVDRADLARVEAQLTRHGWGQVKRHPYDQRYYRQWMHELPPLRHRERLTELDVHHTILPPSGRLNPDPALLLADARPLPGAAGVWTLSPRDMVLHAVVHLFHDGAFERGLRDLVDLDGLVRHFADDPGFWPELVPRARALGLERPLYHALRHLRGVLGTPVPEAVLEAARAGAPVWPLRRLMDALIPVALRPVHPEGRQWGKVFAWWLLYLRGHWLRMPPGLLISHLTRKLARKWDADVRNRRTV